MSRLVLGLDFGTESARALLLDADTGGEVAEAVAPFAHGVIDESLPGHDVRLPRDWALQHPADWVASAREAIAGALERPARTPGTWPESASTSRPAPLSRPTRAVAHSASTPTSPQNPTRGPSSGSTTAPRRRRGSSTRLRDGATNRSCATTAAWWASSGCLPKGWQVLREAPAVYDATARFIEAGDWFVWELTGRETRNACAAGYKALWNGESGYPTEAFLAELDPALAGFYRDKASGDVVAPGREAGRVTEEAAKRFGLAAGTPVSAATIDAHAGVPGAGVRKPGTMVLIMGTSTCHMALGAEPRFFEGYAGLVADGILPGFQGYESGQGAVGDIFAWFVKHGVPVEVAEAAVRDGLDLHTWLSARAARLRPGASGLVALDWHQGNRSVLMDGSLSGALVGMTLNTRPEEIYRALIRADALSRDLDRGRQLVGALLIEGPAVGAEEDRKGHGGPIAAGQLGGQQVVIHEAERHEPRPSSGSRDRDDRAAGAGLQHRRNADASRGVVLNRQRHVDGLAENERRLGHFQGDRLSGQRAASECDERGSDDEDGNRSVARFHGHPTVVQP